jgi:hypothetical protein
MLINCQLSLFPVLRYLMFFNRNSLVKVFQEKLCVNYTLDLYVKVMHSGSLKLCSEIVC